MTIDLQNNESVTYADSVGYIILCCDAYYNFIALIFLLIKVLLPIEKKKKCMHKANVCYTFKRGKIGFINQKVLKFSLFSLHAAGVDKEVQQPCLPSLLHDSDVDCCC